MKKSTSKYLLGALAVLQLVHIYLMNLIAPFWNPLYYFIPMITALICVYFYMKVGSYKESEVLDDYDLDL